MFLGTTATNRTPRSLRMAQYSHSTSLMLPVQLAHAQKAAHVGAAWQAGAAVGRTKHRLSGLVLTAVGEHAVAALTGISAGVDRPSASLAVT